MQQKVLQPGMRVHISYMELREQHDNKSFSSISLSLQGAKYADTKQQGDEERENIETNKKTSKQMAWKSNFCICRGESALHVKILMPVEVYNWDDKKRFSAFSW